uniref:ORF2 n=1 Tax=Panagrellus redivivus TaxID=6233 RepID=A0A7E4V2W6_PANRE
MNPGGQKHWQFKHFTQWDKEEGNLCAPGPTASTKIQQLIKQRNKGTSPEARQMHHALRQPQNRDSDGVESDRRPRQ